MLKTSKLLLELLVAYILLIAGLKGLYWLKNHYSLIKAYRPYLSTSFQITIPFLMVYFFNNPVPQFEKPSRYTNSLLLFAKTSIFIFVPFFLLNHFYQVYLGHHYLHTALLNGVTLNLILTHLFFAALPGEFFFRGYFQWRLKSFLSLRISIPSLKWTEVSLAVPVTALIFAISHSLIHYKSWQLAIFFPGLVFGWLREKSDGLIAPILFHCLANVVMAWIGGHYQ